MEHIHPRGRTVAVIGSGVAGLTAAYVLSARDRVTLLEADTRFGGHAHTQHVIEDGRTVALDTAFLVHNDRTYPTLCRLFDELGIRTQDTDMSMSVRDDGTGLEYAGARGLSGLFPSWSNLGRPRYLLMLGEITRFHRLATQLLRTAGEDEVTLDEFLHRHGFSRYFTDRFITPLVAAVWSCPPGEALRYPARYLFVFLQHHGMLSVFGSPTWRTVVGGSANYVDAIVSRLPEAVTGARVRSVRRCVDGVLVTVDGQPPRRFDAAIIATHPNQALLMLDPPSENERRILGAIPYSLNQAQLHTDDSVLPRLPKARASWNYLIDSEDHAVTVSYDITRLMRLGGSRRYLVTLGGAHLVDPSKVVAEMVYEHPAYTAESVAAQELLPQLNDDRIVFAGAYHGWGFHEDGAASGLRAAQQLGARWTGGTVAERLTC
ncbi:NAD(P)/FAD-dependent oxidoreductase [Mycolicibacterium fortuitum]|uniref:FAD-dependent oxidoreductase n=1 Tax=Mycolicibacterium fortuitum TaxID=1766 RepID=A0AAE4V749_MYCFO|nr:FAD-dependent oxidoreductase [Mycolicibacterium fortuitum]MDV7188869.1 FAD-dependent oxidoreductase [Mycolicibacterium fortuitum]MDV7203345.1 FAD-dependent oxidoreductase [Mycolicibacterium fortuitum]MDV7224989.1 FAD-dependent oxidoreductase [Mycolicibacterium fortuitum]MDV7256072.1 FAD-dependent oxidoreductase [Mycolicibacterium fortuitum]MDV7281922.1 FAD-dependent oxidoreductase [Mycolicibacterium fortuitum]